MIWIILDPNKSIDREADDDAAAVRTHRYRSSCVISVAERLSELRGKRLGFVDNSKCNADLFIQRVAAQLADRYAALPGPVIRKAAPKDRLSDSDFANLAQCDAVVQCFGDCGTSTSISVADAVEIERRGIPTVSVFSTAFAPAARKQAAGRGMADLPFVRIPHPMHTAKRNVVDERADAVVNTLVERLTRHGEDTVEAAARTGSTARDTTIRNCCLPAAGPMACRS